MVIFGHSQVEISVTNRRIYTENVGTIHQKLLNYSTKKESGDQNTMTLSRRGVEGQLHCDAFLRN
jgi:hypothetical protein